jgi:predicted ATPase
MRSLHLGVEPSENLKKSIEDIQNNRVFKPTVFFFENLGFIETTDIRKISFEEALKLEQLHLEVYTTFGYTCMKIPAMSLNERVALVCTSVL